MLLSEDIRWAAKYPFDIKAKKIIEAISLDIEEYNEADLKFILKKAFERTLNSLNNKYSLIWENDYQEVVTFYLSLLIIRGGENEFVYRVFSEAESKRAFRLMLDEDNEKVFSLSKNLGLNLDIDNKGRYRMHFIDFIRLTRWLSGPHWKLYNFKLEKGHVYLNKREIARLNAQKVKEIIYNMIKHIEIVPDFILDYSREIKKRKTNLFKPLDEKISYKDIKEKEFPPCIRTIINNIDKGLPHPARFTLVTFLFRIGYSLEDIINVFNRVPDFDVEKTRYQVEHILGLRGGRKKYFVPSCKKIRSYGFCYPDEYCRYIRSPIQYLNKRKKNEEKRLS